jgi:hypothetical protein
VQPRKQAFTENAEIRRTVSESDRRKTERLYRADSCAFSESAEA